MGVYVLVEWLKHPKCEECGRSATISYKWRDEEFSPSLFGDEVFFCTECATDLKISIPPEKERSES